MEKFAKPGDFCPNAACPHYGKLQQGEQQNLEKFGKTRKGVQRYRCQTCRKTFTETFGTIFYGKRTPEHEILETLAFSKDIQAYRAAASWEDSYYNLIRPHKSLRLPVRDDSPRK